VSSVYPETTEGFRHKFGFIMVMLSKMGLPIFNDEMMPLVEEYLTEVSPKE
jgi:hypothetical protein